MENDDTRLHKINLERGRLSYGAADGRGRSEARPFQGLGGPDSEASLRTAKRGHDPQGLRDRSDALPEVRQPCSTHGVASAAP